MCKVQTSEESAAVADRCRLSRIFCATLTRVRRSDSGWPNFLPCDLDLPRETMRLIAANSLIQSEVFESRISSGTVSPTRQRRRLYRVTLSRRATRRHFVLGSDPLDPTTQDLSRSVSRVRQRCRRDQAQEGVAAVGRNTRGGTVRQAGPPASPNSKRQVRRPLVCLPKQGY